MTGRDARSPLRVTGLQLPAEYGQVEAQLRRVERLVREGPPTELVLLNEAALTGYVSPRGDFDLTRFAEPLDGATAQALAALAVELQVHLVGPLVERDGSRCFNAMVGFRPDGSRFLHYRKRHPWYPETWATPGEEPLPLVEVKGVTISLAICFDVHFLAEESAAQLEQADVLLFPSAWVEEGADTRPALLGGLAERFHLAIVHANWCAGAVVVPGQGHSRWWNAEGQMVEMTGTRPGRIDAW